jgi:hypothetical protein
MNRHIFAAGRNVRPMGGDTSIIAVFLVVVALRFIIPLFIPRFPLPAILAALVLDAADQTIFQQFTDLNLDGYQNYDKALDIFYLTIAFLAVYRNWTNTTAINVARFLWYYRLFGVWLFEVYQERWILFVFPNTFEYFFIAYAAIHTQWDPRRLTDRAVIGLAAFIWIVIKLPQEWWIHIAQNDFTDFMKETSSARPRPRRGPTRSPTGHWSPSPSSWRSRSPRRWSCGGYRKAPPKDWSFRVDVDKPVPHGRAARPPAGPAVDRSAVRREAAPGRPDRGDLHQRAQPRHAGAADRRRHGADHRRQRRRQPAARPARHRMVVDRAAVDRARRGQQRADRYYAVLVGNSLNRSLAFFFGFLLTMVIVLYDRFIGERTAENPPSREQLHLSGAE